MRRNTRLSSPTHMFRRFRRRSYIRALPTEHRHHISQWLLRLLSNAVIVGEPEDIAPMLDAVGLAHCIQPKDIRSRTALGAFRAQLAELERQPAPRNSFLHRNTAHLAKMVGLSALEQEVLLFAALLSKYPLFNDCLDLFGDLDADLACDLLALALGKERKDLVVALRADSVLCATGLLHFNRTETSFDGMLDLLDGLDMVLFESPDNQAHLLGQYFSLSPVPKHPIEAFPHLQKDIELLRRRLDAALRENIPGMNVLLYGEPGTGKTEFVKSLAAALNAPLYTISHETEDSPLEDPQYRFRAYLLTQNVLTRNPRCIVLFDEVEDVFSVGAIPHLGRPRSIGQFRAWTNSVLESNPRPAFWICNNIDWINPAFRRRFTYSIMFNAPPRSVRHALLKAQFANTPVRSIWIERVANNRHLTPALIEQASQLAV